MTAPDHRKPWPMKWVVLAIVVCIVPYTWVTLKYRKEAPAYQPYQDSKDRAQVMRLLDAGYHRLDPGFERLVEPIDPDLPVETITTRSVVGGIPQRLEDVLLDVPTPPDSFQTVQAAPSALAGTDYVVSFTCNQTDREERAESAAAFVREHEILVLVAFDDLPGDLRARGSLTTARITLPTRTLDRGRYDIVLIGTQESICWQFELL